MLLLRWGQQLVTRMRHFGPLCCTVCRLVFSCSAPWTKRYKRGWASPRTTLEHHGAEMVTLDYSRLTSVLWEMCKPAGAKEQVKWRR